MEEHIVSIINMEKLTHNVNRYTLTKPAGYGRRDVYLPDRPLPATFAYDV